MDVGRVGLERLDHDGVHHADDGGLAGGVKRGVEGGVGRLLLARRHLDLAVVPLHDVLHRKGRILGVLGLLEAEEDVVHLVGGGDYGPDL